MFGLFKSQQAYTVHEQPEPPADRDERAVDRQPFVAALLDDLLEACSDRQDGLAGPGATVERDDRDVGVEQQLEREPLLLAARTQPPRFGSVL